MNMQIQTVTADPLLSSCPPCSELMMRDNLFEMVTSSRTFFIQVRPRQRLFKAHLHFWLRDQTRNVLFGHCWCHPSNRNTIFWDHLRHEWDISVDTHLHIIIVLRSMCDCVIMITNAGWFTIRLTARRTCTAGLRPSRGQSWLSVALDAQLTL